MSASGGKGKTVKSRLPPSDGSGEAQLALPGISLDSPASPTTENTEHPESPRGFVRVTRDPDVARSYSDNIALGYAVAQGLARALATISPQDLADLRAKVAQEKSQAKPTARRNGRP